MFKELWLRVQVCSLLINVGSRGYYNLFNDSVSQTISFSLGLYLTWDAKVDINGESVEQKLQFSLILLSPQMI